MARTKQTARMCFMQKVPRQQLVAQKVARKSAAVNIKKSRKSNRLGNKRLDESSQSQAEIESHEVNNQQFSIKFDDQAKCEQQAVNAKIISCTNCQAILTSSSKVFSNQEYKKLSEDPKLADEKKQKLLKKFDSVWICEFCLAHNAIPKTYKVPSVQNPCFLIEQLIKKRSKKNQQKQEEQNNKILIFCIDISTSMETQVHKNKSRLQIVKQALVDEINRMNFEKETIKVGLVTFGSMVTLIGDGKTFKKTNLGSQIYSDFDKIVKQASKVKNFAQSINKSHKVLKNRIQNLGVYGSTALGPGLLASIEIASKDGIGSKVIICTDGQANVGIGSMMMNFFNQPAQKVQNFYEKAAQFAKKKRVQVSILSLKGDKCNLKQLGKLSLATGGSILKIQPSALGTQFSKIAKQEILGTDSQLVIKVNKIFEIISHFPNELSADKTTLTQQFGNFSQQTELTFEFKVLTKQEAALKPGIDLQLFSQPQLPMQVQLTYVGRNGNKYKQVITDWRVPTQNEKQMYDGANFGLFAASVLQKASAKIKSKQFTQAEKIIKGYWSIVSESFSKTQSQDQLNKFGDRIKNIEKILNSKLQKSTGEKRQRSRTKKLLIATKKGQSKQLASKKRSMLNNKISQSKSDSQGQNDMSSDEQEQILWKQMRARSRSNSPAQKSKSKPKRK